MSKLSEINDWLLHTLPRLAAEYEVPGATVAVTVGDEVVEVAAGVLNKNTGVETTTDSLFQIGSITKVWTTTLAMQLVDENLLELDAPVRDYLPDFRIADEDAAARITVRQLMCHTAGFEGDLFTDTGRGDDCVEKYVATLHDTPQLFPPGEMFSYNNAGYVVLGRIVEVMRGKSYDDCLREHLFTPLGLTHTAADAFEAIMFRAATGHLTPDPEAGPQVAPVWALVRSNAPAGSMLAMSASDLLKFARMHMNGGGKVLSASSVAAMREVQSRVPDLALMGDAWGLGWELFHYPQATVIGHDGGTIGQNAFLRLVPEHGVAVVLLTNGGKTVDLYQEIFRHVLRELAGVELPLMPEPAAEPEPVDGKRFEGTYVSSVGERIVTQDADGRIWMEVVPKGIMAELSPESAGRTELVPWRDDTLVAAEPVMGIHMPHAFVGDDRQGRALYLHTGRADRRFKIPVAVAYAAEVAAGRLDPAGRTRVTSRYRIGGIGTAGCADDVEMSWRDLALFMMTMSDNAATDVIFHRVGQAAVDEVLSNLGLHRTRILGCCEDLFASMSVDLALTPLEAEEALGAPTWELIQKMAIVDPQRTTSSTPREITTLLEAIWTDRAAVPEACERVRSIMARQVWPHRLSSGFPADVQVAAKTGTLPSVRNEAGVVTYPDGRSYAVAVFTRAKSLDLRQPAVDAVIGRAGRLAVDHLRSTS